ncbi:3-oxoacyl-ACP reductase family protein [Chitinophaga sp. NPDC101104]|uniref:3-oxoacyl-ACP reductase family protein n=1 Tax=Chitinophaga sp. NPDC101104 TaxID=3390561 RepID=UPI003D0789E6
MKNLHQQSAFVTGGSRGIGAAIVKKLAQEGANVAFTYQSSKEKAEILVAEVKALGVEALAIAADSKDPHAVEAAVDQAAAHFGRLDVLVNNAGIGNIKPLEECSLEDFDETMAVNVRAVFAASRVAVRHMQHGGRIVNIGTCLVDRITFGGCALYSTSKAAITGLTKALARELGPKKINVNIVHPGPIDTDMNPADGPGADYQRSITALGTYGKPEDIAAMVAYLAGPGGQFITGAGFTVDGGTNI